MSRPHDVLDVTDPFDTVRRLYRALNAGDLDDIARLYDNEASAEQVFDGIFCVESRDAIVGCYRELTARWRGRVEVEMVGGIQTGWGWAQADWIELGADGTPRRAGHSHFLIDEGRIRRHRRVVTATGPEAIAKRRPQRERASRRYPSRPVAGVGSVIVCPREGDPRAPLEPGARAGVVLIRRLHEPLAGHWTLPGGTLEVGETLEAGAAREALEETGLNVDVGPVVDVFDRILLDDEGKVRYHFVLVDYLCRPIGGALRAGSDAAEIVVADPDALGPYRLAAKATDIIRRALRMYENP